MSTWVKVERTNELLVGGLTYALPDGLYMDANGGLYSLLGGVATLLPAPPQGHETMDFDDEERPSGVVSESFALKAIAALSSPNPLDVILKHERAGDA